MIKKIGLVLLLCLCIGCSPQKEIITIYTLETCRSCIEVKQSLAPKLIAEGYEVVYYDIDENLSDYKDVLDHLVDVDVTMYDAPLTPLIVYPEHFALTGYSKEMDEKILEIINKAQHNQTYEPIIIGGFWFFE